MKFRVVNFLILIFIVLRVYSQQGGKKLMLVKNNTNYVFSSTIGHSKVNIPVSLSQGEDWIFAKDCVVCDKGTQSKEDCSQKCSKDNNEGIKCSKSFCKVVQQRNSESKGVEQSSRISLSCIENTSQQKIKIQLNLIQKASEKQEHVGLINLLNSKGIFNGMFMLVKDHNKDIAAYYYGREDNSEQKPQWILPSQIPFVIKQASPLKIQIQKQSYKKQESGTNQGDTHKIRPKIFNSFDAQKIGFSENDNRESENNFIDLKDYTLYLSLGTNKILLPTKLYNKLTSLILAKYFSRGQDNESPCSFHDGQLACPEKSSFQIQKLDNVLLTLVIGQKKVDFPIKALMSTCKDNSCTFLIGAHKEKKEIVLGDFAFNIFSILFNVDDGVVSFYRLDNQWGKIYKSEQSYDLRRVNFIWMLVILIFKSIFWILKIIVLVAMVVLLLNLLYHWREVFGWFKQIFKGIKNTDLKKRFEQHNFKDIGNKFNRMSVRIKDRLKEKIKKQSHRFKKLSPSSESQFNMNEQLTKIVSVQDLSDPESDIQAEQVNEETSNQGKKRQIQELLERGKRDLEEKVASRGQIPTLLINQGKKFTENRFRIDSDPKYNNEKIEVPIQPKIQGNLPAEIIKVSEKIDTEKQKKNYHDRMEEQEFYEFQNDQFTDF